MSVYTENVQIEEGWKEILKEEFKKDYFIQIKESLLKEKTGWQIVFPKWSDILNAFNLTPFGKVKVVILWQDPYHGEWEAHWLCFSVKNWFRQPPSLQNIFKEIKSDLWFKRPISWNLTKRAKQWVFLLNAMLTVQKDKPWSHKDIWRQIFTDAVIQKLSDNKKWLVFLLRWAFAQTKESLIDTTKHFVLKSPHPSPFSANKWFFGCKHFSKTNEILVKQWKPTINWDLC